MTVYYVDPFTTASGSGTWASPYSINSVTRTTLVAGDEVRLVARYLTSLLTATVYTATNTSSNQITITAGGGLGADFTVNSFVYFPDTDKFAQVTAISTNLITLGSANSMLPLASTVAGQSFTVRKYDSATVPSSTASGITTGYIYSNTNNVGPITYSDGWVADGVRVTDGTAKSVVRPANTSASMTINIDLGALAKVPYVKNTYDFRNTHFFGNANASSTLTVAAYGCADVQINQLYATNAANPSLGSSTALSDGVTVTINRVDGSLSSCYFQNSTINITNLSFGTPPLGQDSTNNVVNIENYYRLSTSNLGGTGGSTSHEPHKNTVNYNSVIDIYNAFSGTNLFFGYGAYTFNIYATFYSNRRTSTVTSIAYKIYDTNSYQFVVPNISIPTVNCTGISVTTGDYAYTQALWNTNQTWAGGQYNKNVAITNQITAPNAIYQKPTVYLGGQNILFKYLDGSNPEELLTIQTPSNASQIAMSNFPVVSLDATMYVTSGPSFKAYLATYTASYWLGSCSKSIKIPVTSGTSYTISGYIRTDQSTYANGDCRATIQGPSTEITGQDMTTACINAWEQFTLTFTATFTGEVNFTWIMKFSQGAKSIWLDNLTIA